MQDLDRLDSYDGCERRECTAARVAAASASGRTTPSSTAFCHQRSCRVSALHAALKQEALEYALVEALKYNNVVLLKAKEAATAHEASLRTGSHRSQSRFESLDFCLISPGCKTWLS